MEQYNNSFNTIECVKLFDKEKKNIKTLYYGSSKELLDFTEFNEYGWKYIIQKFGLNNNDPLDLILDKTKNDIIGNKVESIMNVRDTLFPTRSLKYSKISKDYFSSVVVNNQKIFLIKIPSGIKTAEFFEYTTDKNCKFSVDFNKEDSYKVLWFVITSGGQKNIEDINLSYISWVNDINPYRNLDNYLVSKINPLNPEVCEYKDGEWKDNSSNTLLGNTEIKNPIILNSIYNTVNKTSRKWNKYVSYSKDQVIYIDEEKWISLTDNNIGEYPKYSNNWILKNKLDLTKGSDNKKNTINLCLKPSLCKLYLETNTDNNNFNQYFKLNYLSDPQKEIVGGTNYKNILLNQPVKIKLLDNFKVSNKITLSYTDNLTYHRITETSFDLVNNEAVIKLDLPVTYKLTVNFSNSSNFKVTVINHIGFYIDNTISDTLLTLKSMDGILENINFRVDGKDMKELNFSKKPSIEDIETGLTFIKTDDILKVNCQNIKSDLSIEIWK